MSLFDVLKYPIPAPLTAEPLWAIPNDLFHKWVTHKEFQSFTGTFSRSGIPQIPLDTKISVFDWFVKHSNSQLVRADVELLRKLIKEYEPV